MKNISENLNFTQSQIKEQKTKLSKNINDTFDELVNELRNRQKELLVELDQIIDGKNKIITEQKLMVNENMEKYGQEKEKCARMIKKLVEITEVKARKLQISDIAQKIFQIEILFNFF